MTFGGIWALARAARRRGRTAPAGALLSAALAHSPSAASALPPPASASAASALSPLSAFRTSNFFRAPPSAHPASLGPAEAWTLATPLCATGPRGVSSFGSRCFSSSIFQMSAPTEVSATKMFGGFNRRYEHESTALGCKMKFTVYTPPEAKFLKFPVVYWLSGLTCTDENFIQKSGAQRYAAEHGVALIAPDTSPRGLNVEGESDSWDFGVGAGFYLNATVEKWKNWRMYDYIVQELPGILASHFESLDTSRSSIMGHSMGGHGALTIFLKNPGKYRSVSAFAPICNPSKCPWGEKAFSGYLGDDRKDWEAYDATCLVANYHGPHLDILIDQGEKDSFLTANQLLPENFRKACSQSNVSLTLRYQGGYDHSYFFIASFVSDHLEFHANALSEEDEDE